MLRWICLFLFICMGCNSHSYARLDADVVVSTEVSYYHWLLINEAVDNWRVGTDHLVTSQVKRGDIQYDGSILVVNKDLPPFTMARNRIYFDDRDPIIYIDPNKNMSPDYFISAFMHELGHTFGLMHDSSGLMAEYMEEDDALDCLDQVTLDQLCALYACKLVTNCEG